jgi:hypothetical protein
MAAGTVFIFVEGNDDERFFKHIFLSKFKKRVKFIKYAQLKKKVVINYLRTIQNSNDDYIFVADIDEMPSVTAKVKWVRAKFEQIRDQKVINLPKKNISIVIIEIESWYIAGMTDSFALANHIEPIRHSEWINKEIFNNFFHGKFRSRIDFMQELLKYYSYDTALLKNKSLDYFDNTFINENVK